MRIFDFHQHICLPDVSGDLLVRYLDTNGIEKALVLALLPCCQVGSNAIVRQAVKNHPDRLIGGVYVDPRATVDAQETIREYADAGFKCVKMVPCFGFYPDDEALFPVYALIEKLGLAVLCHSNGIGPGQLAQLQVRTSYKYTLPWHYDMMALSFPRMNIILAHMGFSTCCLADIFYLVSKHPNVYLDTSSTWGLRILKEVQRTGNQYLYPLDFRKLMWGRDGYCAEEAAKPSVRVQEEHRAIEALVPDGPTRQAIFYDNAVKVLGLK